MMKFTISSVTFRDACVFTVLKYRSLPVDMSDSNNSSFLVNYCNFSPMSTVVLPGGQTYLLKKLNWT